MAPFVRGDVVVIPFPFSDLSATKRRPALVLAALPGDDLTVCQITSQARPASNLLSLVTTDFAEGSLHQDCYLRPERLFTLDYHIIAYKAGHITDAKLQEVLTAVRGLFA